MIVFLFLGTYKGFSQDTLTKKQVTLHRKYDNYYNFYVNSKNGVLSYKEWLKKEKLVDDQGEDYGGKKASQSINDSITYRKIFLNDSINTPKEGREFFNDAIKAYDNEQYADAIRLLTYAINTNINFAFAYFFRAASKGQLKMDIEEIAPDLTMACNLGIPDACIALKKMRNREEFMHFMMH